MRTNVELECNAIPMRSHRKVGYNPSILKLQASLNYHRRWSSVPDKWMQSYTLRHMIATSRILISHIQKSIKTYGDSAKTGSNASSSKEYGNNVFWDPCTRMQCEFILVSTVFERARTRIDPGSIIESVKHVSPGQRCPLHYLRRACSVIQPLGRTVFSSSGT